MPPPAKSDADEQPAAAPPPAEPLPWQAEQWAKAGEALGLGAGQGQDKAEATGHGAEQAASRWPQALLAWGEADIGKAQFLHALSRWLLCKSPAAGGACGACDSCHFFKVGSHPDLLLLGIPKDKRQISVDQARELIEFASLTSFLAGRRVAVIGPAEAMNKYTANALLKCLEEPAPAACFLIYSHAPGNLPATVRSRCQTLPFALPPRDAALAWLRECGIGEEADKLLSVCGDRPLKAQSVWAAGGAEEQLALGSHFNGLLRGRLAAVEFAAETASCELPDLLELAQRAVEKKLRSAMAETSSAEKTSGQLSRRRLQSRFILRDDIVRLRRAVAGGATPNRELAVEAVASRLASTCGNRMG